MKRAPLFACALAMIGMLCLPAPLAHAQPLADRVPADAAVYVGWSGNSSAGYDKSNFKGLADAAKLPQFINAITDIFPDDSEEDAKAKALFRDLSAIVWQYPYCMYIQLSHDPDNPQEPHTRTVVQIDAGKNADQLLATLKAHRDTAAERTPDILHQTALYAREGIIVMTRDEKQPPQDLGGVLKQSLADSAVFKDAMKHGIAKPEGVVFVNAAFCIKFMGSYIAIPTHQDNDPNAKSWKTYSRLAGVNTLTTFLWTGAYEGKEWASSTFIGAPAPRTGLIAMMDATPITEDTLKIIPKNATAFYATSFNPRELMAQLRKLITAAGETETTQFEQGLKDANQEVGFDIENDLISALGSQWLIYSDPTIAAPQGMGLVAVNTLNDPARVEKSLLALRDWGNAKAVVNAGRPGPISPRIQTTQQENVTVHYLAMPMFSPAVAVHEGRLYISVSPQGVLTATAYRSFKPGSILDNPKFTDLRKRLGGKDPHGIGFADLPQTAPQAYQLVLLLASLMDAVPKENGGLQGKLTNILPPFVAIEPFLAPSGSINWTDDAGYHSKSISPFPGANVFNPQTNLNVTSGPTVAFAAGVMLPALGAARRTARQMQSMTQMRGIHQGVMIKAQSSHGNYVPDIGTLIPGSFFAPSYVISPLDTTKKIPPGFDQFTDAQKIAWVNTNCSYAYVPGLKDDNDSEKIVLFEKIYSPPLTTIGICYNDNHVVRLPIDEARKAILAQTGKTLEEWSGPPKPAAPPAPR